MIGDCRGGRRRPVLSQERSECIPAGRVTNSEQESLVPFGPRETVAVAELSSTDFC